MLAARCRTAVADFAPRFSWTKVLEPLISFCRAPRRAPDLAAAAAAAGDGRVDPDLTPIRITSIAGDMALAREYFRAGGVREVGRRAMTRIGRYWASLRSTPS